MRTVLTLAFASLLATNVLAIELVPPPATPKKPVIDEYFGTKVVDDYQWLENSMDPAVKQWSDAQNSRARAYLGALPDAAGVHARVGQLMRGQSIDYGVWGERGGKIFASKIDSKKQQPMVITLDSIDDLKTERTILDPNSMDSKGLVSIDWYQVSIDGSKIGVSLSSNGSENGNLHIYDVAAARETGEVVPNVNKGTGSGSMTFNSDGTGFWYTRYPRGEEHPEDPTHFLQVWYHTIGTTAERDVYELGHELPRIAEINLTTQPDGQWILAEVKNGDGGEISYYLRPTGLRGKWSQLAKFSDKVVGARFGADRALYLKSRNGSPNGKILRLALGEAPTLGDAIEIVKESDGAIQDFVPTKARLYICYLSGGPSQVRIFDPAGRRLSDLPLLPVSTAGGLVRIYDDDILFWNDSYVHYSSWSRFVAAEGRVKPTALISTTIADFSDAEVLRVFARSKDGTLVPLNIIKKKSAKLDGGNPTILYAYGGYGYNQGPYFDPSLRVWLDHGGIYVVANIRGGGEYGERWHLDGNLLKKQNDYDDFYACARWLIDHKYSSPEKLAIMGGSNGGLLMGAALTQHPETYRAVVSWVGIYDMLRVELTPNGANNVTEFGTVKDPAQFKALFGYSPYHHVIDGTNYPSILLVTGANDPRVDPWHSRKFCARLQAATASRNPILLRTSEDAGHGTGSSLDQRIAQTADQYSFLIHELGEDR